MPFKSQAQRRFMFNQHPVIAKRWADETSDMKSLPDKLSMKKKRLKKKIPMDALAPE